MSHEFVNRLFHSRRRYFQWNRRWSLLINHLFVSQSNVKCPSLKILVNIRWTSMTNLNFSVCSHLFHRSSKETKKSLRKYCQRVFCYWIRFFCQMKLTISTIVHGELFSLKVSLFVGIFREFSSFSRQRY